MPGEPPPPSVATMPRYLLEHSHEAHSCATAYAAWSGYDSPLRHQHAIATCASGAHRMFWLVEASDAEAALHQLPEWLAERTRVSEASAVTIP